MTELKNVPFKTYALAAGFFLAFLLLTGARQPLMDAVKLVDANDVHSYLKISGAAPALPSDTIPYHFAQRFVPHYLAGYASRFFHISLETSYFVFNLVLLSAVMLLAARLLFGQGRPYGVTLLAFALAALAPYAFRLNLLVPGMMADLVYLLGLVLCLRGLMGGKIWPVFAGALLAATGKQMILLTLPGLLLYTFVVFGRSRGKAAALGICAALAAATLGANSLLAFFSSGFAGKNTIDGSVVFSLFPWLLSDRFTVYALSEHLLRTFLPAVPFVMLIAAAAKGRGKDEILTWENAALALVALGPVAYAFLPGPAVQMQNQSRYTASAALPMALLALKIIPAGRYCLGKKDLLLLAPVLAAYSYHHKYCVPRSLPEVFLAVHLASLVCFFIWLKLRLPKTAQAERTASAAGEQLPD